METTISFLFLGAIAGWLASIVMGNNKDQGMIGNVIAGVLGAYIGGYIINFLGGVGDVSGLSLQSLGVATLGAIVFIAIKKKLFF